MKVSIPLCKPEDTDFPQYRDKEQLNRWLWRIVQIPYPLYLITTVDENDVPNVEVNTWAMPFGFAPYQMFLFVCGMAHHTAQNALSTGEFVVNVPTEKLNEEIDYCGCHSGRDVDKFKVTGLTPKPSRRVKSPIIDECVAHMECELRQVIETGDKKMYVGEVVEAYADEKLEKGKRAVKYAEGDFPTRVYSIRFVE